jgi:putative PIN family toxin of toxin-antitoxin system
MRVVIDTNVLISSQINPDGAPGQILGLILESRIQVCFDSRILREYREVSLRPKFGNQPEEVGALIDLIRIQGFGVIGRPFQGSILDTSDMPFIEVALASLADFLITGNVRHFPSSLGNTQVVTPDKFIRIFLEHRDAPT